MKLKVNLNSVILPTEQELECLKSFGVQVIAVRRKNYDEFYIESKEVVCELSLEDLVELSTLFKVEILGSSVFLGN